MSSRVFELVREDKGIWRFMIAVFLWESTLAGLRPFILHYFKLSLGASAAGVASAHGPGRGDVRGRRSTRADTWRTNSAA